MRKLLLCFFLAGCTGSQPSSGLSRETLNVADAALSAGNPSLALQISHTILTNNPEDAGAKLHEADALYALGRENAAQLIYQQLYSTYPTQAAAAGLAKCLLRQNPERAASLFRIAIEHSPDNVSFLTNLGVAEDLAGDHDAAKVAYKRVLELDPTQVPAQADLALSLALSGRPEQAADMLRPLATAQDSTARLRQDYGAVLALAGHADQGAIILATDLPSVQAYQAAWAYNNLTYSNLESSTQK